MICMIVPAHVLYCKISVQCKKGMTDAWAKHLLHLNTIHMPVWYCYMCVLDMHHLHQDVPSVLAGACILIT